MRTVFVNRPGFSGGNLVWIRPPRLGSGIAPVWWTPRTLSREVFVQCPRAAPPHPAEFRRQMVELVRAGRDPNDLAREFEPSEQAICNWVAETDRSEGRRDAKPPPADPGLTAVDLLQSYKHTPAYNEFWGCWTAWLSIFQAVPRIQIR